MREKFPNANYSIRAAILNAGQTVFKPFLEITPEEIQNSLEVSVAAAFAFSREAILSFRDNDIEEPLGKRGTLIFTGATASLRGNTQTSLLAAGKFGARALSQSLAKEFGKDNIHVRTSFLFRPETYVSSGLQCKFFHTTQSSNHNFTITSYKVIIDGGENTAL